MPFTKGHKINIGKKFTLGKHWKLSDETKKKQSLSRKGIIFSDIHRKKLSDSHRKKRGPHKEETKRKIGEANRFRIRLDIKGSKNWGWKGGVTSNSRRIRNSIQTKLWRDSVFARDNFTCQKTKERGVYLVAHHIQNFSEFPELRTSIENGITLSKQAHLDFHNKYGRKNNTKEQLVEFLKQKND